CTVSGKKAHGGVATISKIKPKETWAGFRDGDKLEESRILACIFGRLLVVNTYCPQGQDPESEVFQYKLKWFSRLRKMFDEFYKKSGQVLWLGDFNVAPEPIDVYDSKRIMGHVCHRLEVFEALANVREWGFIDLFRKFHPNEPGQYSYWDYRFPSLLRANRGWRVDHMYVSPPLAKKATECRIDPEPRHEERPSDHTFMLAEFDL
ncbi:MAG: exodeoxyribonuclease III, partial [bacterium]